ncbi:hypothetical protein CYMTET_54056 [Cymbomonas tetramitiformis]|uniref:Uncharacterized protein n=1 Tax=Cymbomonas tetramitiformis TaxID=36881 RepID=A0AAE0EQ06_9CHLO|nr:hypothetical protein CYMTET_54056 [Cymbomonas tetramitiformis]
MVMLPFQVLGEREQARRRSRPSNTVLLLLLCVTYTSHANGCLLRPPSTYQLCMTKVGDGGALCPSAVRDNSVLRHLSKRAR